MSILESIKMPGDEEIIEVTSAQPVSASTEEPAKKKRGRPTKEMVAARKAEEERRLAEQQQSAPLLPSNAPTSIPIVEPAKPNYTPMCSSNDPYESTYNDSIGKIEYTIYQMDNMAQELKDEFDQIRAAKTLKGRYHYLSSMGESICSVLNSKLSAIKERNAITTKCHELEMKRLQINKDAQAAEDDDHYIANMYSAYINTPINAGSMPGFLQQTAQNTIGNPGMMMGGTVIAPNGDITDAGYNNFMQTITPEQNRMINENNPNIKEVVVYDPSTGETMFDVVDTRTGLSVPNFPRTNQELLAETNIDLVNGRATNSNLGKTWEIMTSSNIKNNLSKF